MERRKLILFSVISSICIVAAVVIILLYLNKTTDTPEVHLPQATAGISSDTNNEGEGGGEFNKLNYAELRPDTVQYILEIIEKPKSYSCNYIVESYWENGNAYFDVSVYVKDNVFSVDILSDAYMKRCIFTDEDYYIWYVDEKDYFQGKVGTALGSEKIADTVQMSGSYKDLMDLESSKILETDYVEVEGVYCVYVKAEIGQLGYISEYYIYPDTGLLFRNEIYDGETLVYRMNSNNIMLTVPYNEYFTLPGGKLIS